jgi:hypothetical protein
LHDAPLLNKHSRGEPGLGLRRKGLKIFQAEPKSGKGHDDRRPETKGKFQLKRPVHAMGTHSSGKLKEFGYERK